jgi:hypothetical protein
VDRCTLLKYLEEHHLVREYQFKGKLIERGVEEKGNLISMLVEEKITTFSEDMKIHPKCHTVYENSKTIRPWLPLSSKKCAVIKIYVTHYINEIFWKNSLKVSQTH